MKTNLSHVRVNVSNIKASVEWYENILGFECSGINDYDTFSYADFLSQSGAVFALSTLGVVPTHARLNFDCLDVNAFYLEIKDKVTIIEPLVATPWGTRKFTISDPDGNELGFVEQDYRK